MARNFFLNISYVLVATMSVYRLTVVIWPVQGEFVSYSGITHKLPDRPQRAITQLKIAKLSVPCAF